MIEAWVQPNGQIVILQIKIMLYTAQNGKKTLQMTKLQCDFCHPGHLDKVDQSDYRKITTHSKIESKVKKKKHL